MGQPLLSDDVVEQEPDAYLDTVGRVFAVFNEDTQDSGNVSYGVQIGRDRISLFRKHGGTLG